MIGTVLEIAGVVLLVLGLTLATIGLYGLLRMPAIFDQLKPRSRTRVSTLVFRPLNEKA